MIRSELRITPHYSGNSQPAHSPSANSCASSAIPNETEPKPMTGAIWVATLADCYRPGAEVQLNAASGCYRCTTAAQARIIDSAPIQ